MKVLIVKTSSMGDVVHAAPLASDIAAQVPGAQIDWVVEESFAAIPRLHPAVSQVIPIALRRWRKSLLSADMWREIGAARAALRAARYDVVIDCQGLLKSAWVARWARGKATQIVGPDRASAREPIAARLYDRTVAVPRGLHAIERNRHLGAAALGYEPVGPPHFDLQAPALVNDALAAATREPFAVVFSNASRASKLWPDAYWRAAAQTLDQLGLNSVLFWGSDAERSATAQRAALMPGAIVAPPRTGIDQIAAVIKRARVVVGLDTGLTHLAAALGVPTVGIFCDYDPKLVGVTGDAECENLGGTGGGPEAAAVRAAIERVLVRVR
jgi:heptosyltransferase-1